MIFVTYGIQIYRLYTSEKAYGALKTVFPSVMFEWTYCTNKV